MVDMDAIVSTAERRQDEVPPPYATVDFQTVDDDNSVTIRHRNSMEQVRVPVGGLVAVEQSQLASVGGL